MDSEGLADGNKISRILVAIDGSVSGDAAFTAALEEAAVRGAHLHAVYVIDPDRYLDLAYDADSEFLYEESDRVRPGPILEDLRLMHRCLSERAVRAEVNFEFHTRVGNARREILALAEECRADRVVVGSTGKTALDRLLLGSVSSFVLMHSPVEVMVVSLKPDFKND